MKKISKKRNYDFYFVYLPSLDSFSQNKIENKKFLKIKKLVSKENIKFINIYSEFLLSNNNPNNFFNPYGHFNKMGYKLVGETLFKEFNK